MCMWVTIKFRTKNTNINEKKLLQLRIADVIYI